MLVLVLATGASVPPLLPGQFLVGWPIPPATPIFGMRDSDFGADQLRNIQKLSMRNLYFS